MVIMACCNGAALEGTTNNIRWLRGKEHHPQGEIVLTHLKKKSPSEINRECEAINDAFLDKVKAMGAFREPLDAAIDWTDKLYYGVKGDTIIISRKPKDGTDKAFRIANIDVKAKGNTHTLAMIPVVQIPDPNGPFQYTQADMDRVVKSLVEKAEKWITINTLLLDRGFFNTKVISILNERGTDWLMPVVKNGKISDIADIMWSTGKHAFRYIMEGKNEQRVAFNAFLIKREEETRSGKKRKGKPYYIFATSIGLCREQTCNQAGSRNPCTTCPKLLKLIKQMEQPFEDEILAPQPILDKDRDGIEYKRHIKVQVPVKDPSNSKRKRKQESIPNPKYLQREEEDRGCCGLLLSIQQIEALNRAYSTHQSTLPSPQSSGASQAVHQVAREIAKDSGITVIPTSSKNLGSLAGVYSGRWIIETGYRVKDHEFLGFTTSNNFAVRLLFQWMSVILFNLWSYLELLFRPILSQCGRNRHFSASFFKSYHHDLVWCGRYRTMIYGLLSLIFGSNSMEETKFQILDWCRKGIIQL